MQTIPVCRLIVPSLLLCCLAACERSAEPVAALDEQTLAGLQSRVDLLGDEIESAESLRAIRRLQWAYGHYSEFGLWHDFADLFADTGIGHYTQGDLDREGIRSLFLEQVGQGQLGLATGRIYPHISFSPVLSLSENGLEAAGRFRILAMLGGYGGNAIWFHGVYQNAYVKERNTWKIDEVWNAAQISGSFAAGLSSQTGAEPAIVFFYSPDEVTRLGLPVPRPAIGSAANAMGANGAPIAAAGTTAAETDVTQLANSFAVLQRRLDRLEDEAAIVNLQHRYGYLLDRHDWDALVALFADEATFEPGLRGVYVGRTSIRRAFGQFGDTELAPGEIDDHILFQTYVSVAPDGRSAKARVDELGLRGQPGVDAQWTQGIYENSFVRENGEWRIASLHYYPRLITDYAKGWGADAQPAPGPDAAFPADAPPSESHGVYPEFHIPAFHFAHPVTGSPPQYPEGDPAIGKAVGFADSGTAAAAASPGTDPATWQSALVATDTRVRRALAYDAVENLVNAYAYFIDECSGESAAELFAETGEVRTADGAAARGAEGIATLLQSAYCPGGRRDGEFTLHHAVQPVITVADDGRAATFSARLWEVHASAAAADRYRGGMLDGEAVYDEGRWQITALGTRELWNAPVSTGQD